MARDWEDVEHGGSDYMFGPCTLVDLTTKPHDLGVTIACPLSRKPKTPSILEDLEFVTLKDREAEPASCPPSPVDGPCTSLPHSVSDSGCAETLSTALSATLGKLRTLDTALDNSAGFSSYRDDPVWRKVMRNRIKAPLTACDEAYSWYRDFAPSDLELIREAFVAGIEEYRDRHPSSCAPLMPSMLNPLRREAPSRSWVYLENPYKFCRNWKMQSGLQPTASRSRFACDMERQGRYANSRHCSECRRESLCKSLLSSRFQDRIGEAHFPPGLFLPSIIQHKESYVPCRPASLRSLPGAHWIHSPSLVISIEPFGDYDDDDDEYIHDGVGKSDNLIRQVRDEFSYDYRGECPDSPRLQDLDDISDTSDDEGLWDSMDWEDEDYETDALDSF